MFNIGFGEFLIIAVLLIIVVGPDRLPALMRTVGKTLRSVRQASNDLRASAGLDELLNQDPMSPPPKASRYRERRETARKDAAARKNAEPKSTDTPTDGETGSDETDAEKTVGEAATAGEVPGNGAAAGKEAKADKAPDGGEGEQT